MNKNKKKQFFILVLAFFLLFIFFGCGITVIRQSTYYMYMVKNEEKNTPEKAEYKYALR